MPTGFGIWKLWRRRNVFACRVASTRKALPESPEMPSELLTTREGTTLVLTISDPGARNTLSPQVYTAGVEALNIAESDASLRAVILRGDGEHFCAGGDLNRITGLRQAGPQAQSDSIALFHSFIDSIRAFPKPVIAAVEGWAAGGGMSLALACDLVVAARDARFAMSYAKIGLTPDGGGSWHVAQALPRALALELLWLAQPVDAPRLHALGVVNRVTDKGQALVEALALASQLAAMAPNAVAAAKELVAQARHVPLAQHLESERQEFVRQLFHENGAEGLRSFAEKRPAQFR